MKKIIFTVVLLLWSGAVQIAVPTDNQPASGQVDSSLTGAEAVLKAVKTSAGFSNLKVDVQAAMESAKQVTMLDSTTPFLAEQLNNRTALLVTLKDVPLNIEKVTGPTKTVLTGTRDFELYIDPVSGKLLKIVSTLDDYWKKLGDGEIRKPLAAAAEKELRRNLHESYDGIPEQEPAISFLDALNAVVGNPVTASQIVAWYVLRTTNRRTSAVWVIHLYGISHIGAIGREKTAPIYQRNHLRSIINAQTGRLISAGNCPSATNSMVTEEEGK